MKIATFVLLCFAALLVSDVSADWQSYVFKLASPKLIPTYKLIDKLMMKLLMPISKQFFDAFSPLVCA
jgi:hypothetical protein